MTTDDDVTATATRFIDAIVWGEHLTVWKLMSQDGREFVLDAGSRRGLDPMQAQRIRLGTSPQQELDAFLTGLIHGLRVDFAAVPLHEVKVDASAPAPDDEAVEVSLYCPANFGEGRWAAGSLVMSRVDGTWVVDRVRPVVTRSD